MSIYKNTKEKHLTYYSEYKFYQAFEGDYFGDYSFDFEDGFNSYVDSELLFLKEHLEEIFQIENEYACIEEDYYNLNTFLNCSCIYGIHDKNILNIIYELLNIMKEYMEAYDKVIHCFWEYNDN